MDLLKLGNNPYFNMALLTMVSTYRYMHSHTIWGVYVTPKIKILKNLYLGKWKNMGAEEEQLGILG